jgi:hypothetical protein
MKKLSTILFVCFFISSLFAGAVISEFRGDAGMNQVELKWVVTAEQGLKGYRILRSMDGTSFSKVGFVAAEGLTSNERSYKYIDKSVFKSSNRTFYYKIQFVNLDNSTSNYEKMVTVSPQISSARQTWGSLKAMFR